MALLVTAAGVYFAPVVFAQMVPDAPIRNFRLPRFGDDGYKIWELSGDEGRYISADQSEILGLDLKVYSGDAQMLLRSRIRSPRALIHMDRSEAEGDSRIEVEGPAFTIEGANWHWNGREERIRIGADVRVTFNQKLDILR